MKILHLETLFVGRVLHTFAELGSTNTYALQLIAKSKPPEGTVILAETQTAGRGQHGSYWATMPNDNLTFSLILYPRFMPVGEQFDLSRAVALALSDTLAEYLPAQNIAIKWANDIYINDKKVAGVLIENGIDSAGWSYSVVGIGLNINQLHFEGLPNAVSLRQAIHREIDKYEVLSKLCEQLERRYLTLRTRSVGALRAHYIQNLYRYGEDACFERVATGELLYGRIVGVSEQGQLQLLLPDGVHLFSIKEIRFL